MKGCTKGKDCGKDGTDKAYVGQRELSFFGTSSLLAKNLNQEQGICIDNDLLMEQEDLSLNLKRN